MIIPTVKYSLQDLAIVPEDLSRIEHRGDINVQYENGYYPLITAPMESVISQYNYQEFENNHIMAVIPRTVTNPIRDRLRLATEVFCAFSLKEVEELFTFEPFPESTVIYKICIDMANGHMKKLYDVVSKIKKIHPKYQLMVGNIANPKTYAKFAELEVDYIRCGIGGGSRCTTSSNSSVHYPMGSLIDECYQLKKTHNYKTNIIADGGIGNFDDINTALALGADYVMCGKLFAQTKEAWGGKVIGYRKYDPKHPEDNRIDVIWEDPYIHINEIDMNKYTYQREYYGMSTKRAQMLMGIDKSKLRTAEGISKMVEIQYTLEGWIDNFKHYLRTAMSYTDSNSLSEYIGQVVLIVISQGARGSYFK